MKDTLIKRLLAAAGTQCTLTPDYLILNDTLSAAAIEKLMQITPGDAAKVVVFIDHDTPNSSIEVGLRQRKLIDWAVAKKVPLEKGQGVGYLRLLENYVQPGQILIGPGNYMSGLGAAGALGLSVDEATLLQVLASGRYNFPCPSIQVLSLAGRLPDYVSAQDAALALSQYLRQEKLANTLLLLKGETAFSLSERYDLCHYLAQTGIVSAIFTQDSLPEARKFSLEPLQPLAALPGEAERTEQLKNLPKLPIDEVFIGGCRGGKLADLRQAAAVLKGKHIAYGLHVIIAPATSRIYLQALQEGLIDIFLDCGAVVMNQGCSVCWGKAQGILDAGEILVSTGSYHYPGCSGDQTAKVYLVSPAIAAQCALTGKLA